jgi:hypothetical protein
MTDRTWPARLQKGDVVRARSGRLRIVRYVSHRRTGPETVSTCVSFIIGHRSWTGRPVTTLTGNDLIQFGYRPTGARAKLNTAFDWAIERELEWPLPPIIRPEEVLGIP